ncbi:MAG: apolipoprotein N-acyltransferase [Pseudomonadota bacterium]
MTPETDDGSAPSEQKPPSVSQERTEQDAPASSGSAAEPMQESAARADSAPPLNPPAQSGFGRFVTGLSQLSGFKRLFAALLAGAVSAFAFAPVYAVPLLIPCLYVLLAVLPEGEEGRRRRVLSFSIGFAFGLGHFLVGLYWITYAFLVNAEKFASLAPVALIMLAAVLAVFVGFVTMLTARVGATGLSRVLVFAGLWVGAEWLRGHVLTGFPWNLIGYTWADFLPTAQGASLFGVFGLSLLTVLGCGSVYAAFPANRGGRIRIGGVLGMLVGFGGLIWISVWGADRIPDTATAAVENVRLRLVQPSIDQAIKWRRDLRDSHFAKYIELTRAPGYEGITHVIWPETALPFFLAGDAARLSLVGSITPRDGLVITGAPRRAVGANGDVSIFNSLHAVAPNGEIVDTYDKAHLVPFGEYVPYQSYLPLGWLNVGGGGFSPGPGLRAIDVAGLPTFSALICYEIIFPGNVISDGLRPHFVRDILEDLFPARFAPAPPAPKWLLNLTNDAWFGESFGPHQHLATARIRGIEEGLPVIRSANTGISVAFDPYGRELGRIGLNVRGILDTDLPEPVDKPTLFSRWGNSIALLAALFALSLGFLGRNFVVDSPKQT